MYAGPAQPFTTAEERLDDLDHDLYEERHIGLREMKEAVTGGHLPESAAAYVSLERPPPEERKSCTEEQVAREG